MRKILITGGAGFIGSSLADKLAEDQGNSILIVDNLSTGKKENIPQAPNVQFINGDVNNHEVVFEVMNDFRPDVVFHYAAVVGVKKTIDDPIAVLDDTKGFENIFEAAVNYKVKRMFFSSSSEVYGEPVEMPQNEETTPLNARLPYAVVKNLGEVFAKSYEQMHQLNYTIFRFFNTYGPKQREDFVVSKFIAKAKKGDDITIYGDGKQTRSFCYIDDNIDACLACLEQNKFVNGTVNIGSEIELTILDLATTIIRLCRSSSKIVHLPPLPAGDMTRRRPDIRKMKTLLNRPPLSLEDGLVQIIEKPPFVHSTNAKPKTGYNELGLYSERSSK